MAKQKVTQEQWAEQRKLWERSATVSYADIAANLLISKALVGQESKRAGWVKSIHADQFMPKSGVEKQIDNLQNSRDRAALPSNLDGQNSSTRPSDADANRQVDGVATEAIANRSAPSYDEIQVPHGLDSSAREDFIKAAIVARQRQINATQSKELAAVKQKLYNAVKNAAGGDGPALALAVERNVRSMVAMHDAELKREIAKVRLDMAEFEGAPVRPAPIRISVLIVPGHRIGGGNPELPAGSWKVEVKDCEEASHMLRGGDVQDVESKEVDRE